MYLATLRKHFSILCFKGVYFYLLQDPPELHGKAQQE